MGNPYAADFADDTGQVRLGGEITFTDNANQPGGGSVADSRIVVQTSGNGSLVNDTYTSVSFASIEESAGSDLSWVIGTPTLVTINTAGVYAIEADVIFQPNSESTGIRGVLLITPQFPTPNLEVPVWSDSLSMGLSLASAWRFQAGDQIGLKAIAHWATTPVVINSNALSIVRLS